VEHVELAATQEHLVEAGHTRRALDLCLMAYMPARPDLTMKGGHKLAAAHLGSSRLVVEAPVVENSRMSQPD
jgi:hypothetical protein